MSRAGCKELIGDAAGRLHTARSRNDQVATDFRLYVRDAIDTLLAQIKTLQLALVTRAEDEAETIMPGFTHLQNAQPVTFGHHLLAYVEMLGRDCRPLRRCAQAPQRKPARLRGAGRHALPDRPRHDRRRRSASTARRPTRSTPSPTATSSSRRWQRREPLRHAPSAASPRSW